MSTYIQAKEMVCRDYNDTKFVKVIEEQIANDIAWLVKEEKRPNDKTTRKVFVLFIKLSRYKEDSWAMFCPTINQHDFMPLAMEKMVEIYNGNLENIENGSTIN